MGSWLQPVTEMLAALQDHPKLAECGFVIDFRQACYRSLQEDDPLVHLQNQWASKFFGLEMSMLSFSSSCLALFLLNIRNVASKPSLFSVSEPCHCLLVQVLCLSA